MLFSFNTLGPKEGDQSLQQDQPQSLAWKRQSVCGRAHHMPAVETVVACQVQTINKMFLTTDLELLIVDFFPSTSKPRFERLPVSMSGGLRDDCSGAHAFLFFRRKGWPIGQRNMFGSGDLAFESVWPFVQCTKSVRDLCHHWCCVTNSQPHSIPARSTWRHGNCLQWTWQEPLSWLWQWRGVLRQTVCSWRAAIAGPCHCDCLWWLVVEVEFYYRHQVLMLNWMMMDDVSIYPLWQPTTSNLPNCSNHSCRRQFLSFQTNGYTTCLQFLRFPDHWRHMMLTGDRNFFSWLVLC